MTITVLIENTAADSNLKCEHGLSILIEHDNRKYLLDAGSTTAFCDNAKTINISLEDIDTCVLSHGHYDHSGGFYEYLNMNRNALVYAMDSATGSYHSAKGGMHEIGIPAPILEKHLDRFCFINNTYSFNDGVYLIPHSSANLKLIGQKAGLFKKCNEEYVPDDFAHELSLVFDTEKGLIIFNSCSHAGIINIIDEVSSALPGRSIYAFIGGLHMEGKDGTRSFCTFSEAEIKEIADKLEHAGLKYLYTGHCTGNDGFGLLKKYLGQRIIRLTTGMSVAL